jgi:tetratricopeptide (TPR) repeat protein
MVQLLLVLVKKLFSKNVLLYFLLPAAAIFILSSYSPLAGIAGTLAYILLLMYINRTKVFSYAGSVNYSKGSIEKALVWFERAYKSGRAKPKTVTSYAYLLLKSGNIGDARKILEKQMDSNILKDEKIYAKANMALVKWKQGELHEAIEILEEVIPDFENSTIYGSLGYLLIQNGDLDKALEFNLKAYEYNDSNDIILDNLAQVYYLRGEYDKALEIFDKLIPKKPSFPEAYYNYGLTLHKTGDNENALENMNKALEYKTSFLSTVTKDEIKAGIDSIERVGEIKDSEKKLIEEPKEEKEQEDKNMEDEEKQEGEYGG